MAKKKKKQKKARHYRSPQELLIAQKAKALRKAEEGYWKKRDEIIAKQLPAFANALDIEQDSIAPLDLSSTIWALIDGAAFVRYKKITPKPRHDFRVLNITLEQWGISGYIVPTSKGEFSLAQAGIARGIYHIELRDCQFNDVHVPYVQISHIRYGAGDTLPSTEKAIYDFQLTISGIIAQRLVQPSPQPAKTIKASDTIAKLKSLADLFEKLLGDASKEEELQTFLKDNTLLLHPSATVIPKKKLGEDFVTDFVLLRSTSMGPVYTLIELERANYKLLTQTDETMTSSLVHAHGQTRDWDVWIEKHKSYLRDKLPGFETPEYWIIIGRSTELTETQKAKLRSYNRGLNNTTIKTYDDLLVEFRESIKNLEQHLSVET